MLKCSTSLWSADLANLAADIRRVEPYSDRFHLDVSDGHFCPTMLFFPDLVASIRPHTRLPLEAHLMTTDPLAWIEPFAQAGIDGFIFCYSSMTHPSEVLRATKAAGKFAGISLALDEDLDLLTPHWDQLDIITIMGTELGIKGASMDERVPAKIRRAKELIHQRGRPIELQSDGGIRRTTVPLLATAGADSIVPGSLMFKENPAEMRRWLATLGRG